MGYPIYSSDAGSNEGVLLVRWPFVSREMYEAMLDQYERAFESDRQRWLDSYRDLLDKYHALKLSGASIPEPPKTLERPEFDPVMAAITAKAGPDRKLRAMMAGEAMRSRQAGIPDIEIIQAIEQGVTVDEEGVA